MNYKIIYDIFSSQNDTDEFIKTFKQRSKFKYDNKNFREITRKLIDEYIIIYKHTHFIGIRRRRWLLEYLTCVWLDQKLERMRSTLVRIVHASNALSYARAGGTLPSQRPVHRHACLILSVYIIQSACGRSSSGTSERESKGDDREERRRTIPRGGSDRSRFRAAAGNCRSHGGNPLVRHRDRIKNASKNGSPTVGTSPCVKFCAAASPEITIVNQVPKSKPDYHFWAMGSFSSNPGSSA